MDLDSSPYTNNVDEARQRYEQYPEFNQWLDTEDDGVNLELREDLRFTQPASWIAYSMDEVFYGLALQEYRNRRVEEFKEVVRREFPTPIAFYFHRTERGYQHDMQRLFLLKDTWEALIFTLFAIVVGEARYRGLNLQESGLRNSDWYSDQLFTKLRIISLILESAIKQEIELASQALISTDILEQIRELNRYRNGFSHTAAKSDLQARELFNEYIGDVVKTLQAVEVLKDVIIMRFVGQGNDPESPYVIRCEVFQGRDAGRVPSFDNFRLTPNQYVTLLPLLTPNRLLVKNGDCIYPLSPFLLCKEDNDGHSTELLIYKQKNAVSFIFERVGHSDETPLDRSNFTQDYEELLNLLQ